jgi:hypothetical protein
MAVTLSFALRWKNVDGDWKCVKTVDCGSAVRSISPQDGSDKSMRAAVAY